MPDTCLSLLHDSEANQLSSLFQRHYDAAFADYFSRDPAKWPIFSEPGLKSIHDFRQQRLNPNERIAAYPNGLALQQHLAGHATIAQQRQIPDGTPDEMLTFAAALSKDWENPSSVENVVTMPCDPAIYGSMMGAMANPNLAYSEYAGMADQLEKYVIRQIANQVGYDPEQSTGIFTQGGTFCNLYGYLLGLRKSLPMALQHGMGRVPDFRIINSQGGHYSNMTNLSLLGVDIKDKTIRIKVTDSHDMDYEDLERQLRACFAVNCRVPTIMVTMGTTDTFAVDRIKPVYELRNRLCEEYEVEVKPHIHVDAAVGWSMIFFLDYDFHRNPLDINPVTLSGIERTISRVKELKYADSFTVDFHKWGYVPYTSSLVMIKNKQDMKALENEPENFSYFEHDLQGQTHLQSTIECSRGAVGVFGAYAALKYMGIEGYQTILAHCLQNANYFRHQLLKQGNVKLMAPENQGPSVGFRLYNPQWVDDVCAEFAKEQQCMTNPEYMEQLRRNSQWHRSVFKERGKVGLYTNWVEFISRSAYNPTGKYSYIPGEKAVFMNPATGRSQIDLFMRYYS
ncbi:pyridoxal phosphate-dependent decarboxylase family protein [Photobacterium lutimaris]|uniref:Aspartate aminotransferase family protein n=1 Tax=Photobacterium lutimaris TaxID=388278 RepID=A0A2T3IUR7_9GAMM|nr:pyridoxal-dependent decarboxylase [Photobacterium lutimaris]PSU32126.1 aspartate aminotransferase family protein [Photobacterium lutimaris]TDR73787.1 glutamate/tyrosine decarboxylase-like PLP-dependent enzyme [Photobacterium lutimaris]